MKDPHPQDEITYAECLGCGEDDPRYECPNSKRKCGHHCNHLRTHDKCCWYGTEIGDDGDIITP